MWQFEDSEICSIGMVHPSHSRHSGLSLLSSVSQFSGISTLSGCASPEHLDRLPELPAAEEKRLRRAAQVLQQKLVLRQWLATRSLQHVYTKLLSLDVSSLEDVYWLEDSIARHVIDSKDFNAWSLARQSLPTGKDELQALKNELWNTVVKNSKHQDAWTWGGMLIVSVSVCGLVTLAAMTQPSLAPEAKHSLLQYVTGKYLHPPSCKVEWGWEEPQSVGETMCFTVHCYQRNGHPYPICDTDDLAVHISHGTRKVTAVVELGSGQPALAHTARVKFTVRTAGVYVISILIGGVSAAGGPFRKWFVAGGVAAGRSRVNRAPAALVCAAGRPRALHVHPRDHYDNPATLANNDAEGFSIEIKPIGGDSGEESLSAAAQFEYDSVNQRVSVTLCFPRAGVFRAAIYYEGVLLHNGQFDCIVLTPSDAATVQRQLSSKRATVSYEAKLLSPGKQRRVLCCLSPKQLIIKDYVLKIIPKRITSFRVCPSTKLIVEGQRAAELVLEDGAQAALRLHCSRRDLLAATFTQLLIANCGGEDSFKNKQEFFYSSLRARHLRQAHDKLALRVRRADLLRSSLKATKHFTLADWCKNFDVAFQGEQGVDWGGVRREWFSLVCSALFDARGGLFVSYTDSPAGLVHPNPDRPPHLKLKHFEFAGKVVGKCLYESALGGSYRQLVRARLARSFLAHIIGLRVHYKYFEQDDPELYLSKIKYILETDLDAADAAPEIYFSDDVYDSSGKLKETKELVPNGASIRVSNSTKMQYLDALAQWRLAGRWRAESEAFLRGLTLLVPDNLLAIFDENELELLMCGTGEVVVSDWRAHALVAGAGRDWERRLAWLWAALNNFTNEERARLLQFTTGCSQLPPNGFQVRGCGRRSTTSPTRSGPVCCSSLRAARSCRPTASRYVAVGGAQQLHQRGAGPSAAVHYGLLAAAAQRLPGTWLWAALNNFTNEERARLLQFTTGCSQLPPNGFQVRGCGRRSTTSPTRSGPVCCSSLRAARSCRPTASRYVAVGGAQQLHQRGAGPSAAVHYGLLAAAAQRLPGTWLWAALNNFTNEERARLLQFTTGCSQLPPNGFQVRGCGRRSTTSPTRSGPVCCSSLRAARSCRPTASRYVAVGGAQQLHQRGAGPSAAVHYGLLAAAAQRLPGTWLWAALNNFTNEERARLLQFTTGCSQLPPNGFQVRGCGRRSTTSPTRSGPVCCSSLRAARSCRPTASRYVAVGGAQQLHQRGAGPSAAVHYGLLAAAAQRLPGTWLWAALNNFTNEERARLLQFTTGCSQLPPNGFQVRGCGRRSTTSPTRSGPVCCSSLRAARSCRPTASRT
ncbi:apoptosis-resistant E3 ubiquitin protein ligase 1 isoform X2 [Colias croceus]|uniref:apoptosis-resistant E3 ubiquitin protein ligase 1 isoform X2 n=1 Tax=Colias crocea TaxID=72248 RepID=UPI001E27F849|nr:apoptosis-resistant E3 ubiquitin protein ligase 1 isoform X2 [Colias croceus]